MENTQTTDRNMPPSEEIKGFSDDVSKILMPFGISKRDAYWLTNTRSWCTPQDETSYHLIFANTWVEMDLGIFDLSSYFVDISFKKCGSNHYNDKFSLYNFTTITRHPSFDRSSCEKLSRKEYLDKFLEYLKTLVNVDPMSELLTGKYWFSFYFDLRDWATTPGLESQMRSRFELFRQSKV